jgi:phosphopantothenoylcysteine synthetase/decarboxylase
MPSFGSDTGNVLYLIVCAAPPATRAPEIAKLAADAGWDVSAVVTPAALDWVDVALLADATGHTVRSTYRRPDEPEYQPLGDAILVAPATFNTINKWAAGINDTLALGLLNEALGRKIPTVVCPWLNDALASHPAYQTNTVTLREAGVLFEPVHQTQLGAFVRVALDSLHITRANP